MYMWEIALIGFIFGLLGASCYYLFKQIVKIYRYILEGGKLF